MTTETIMRVAREAIDRRHDVPRNTTLRLLDEIERLQNVVRMQGVAIDAIRPPRKHRRERPSFWQRLNLRGRDA